MSVFETDIGSLLNQAGGLGMRIKSIQQFSISITTTDTTDTATISSIVTANSFLVVGGTPVDPAASNQDLLNNNIRCDITNATTITGTRSASSNGTGTVTGYVVELEAGSFESIQNLTHSLNTTSPTTDTITSVDASKTLLFPNGWNVPNVSVNASSVLTNGTTVTTTFGPDSTATTIGYSIVELK